MDCRCLETLFKAAKEDQLDLEIIDGLWKDCIVWRCIINIADSNNVGTELQ